jgi:hypothetical protein
MNPLYISGVNYDILLRLPYEDIIAYCLTHRQGYQICQDNNFWEKKLKLDFPSIEKVLDLPYETNLRLGSNIINWKERYLEELSVKDVSYGSEKYIPINLCFVRAVKKNNLPMIRYFEKLGADDWETAAYLAELNNNSTLGIEFSKKALTPTSLYLAAFKVNDINLIKEYSDQRSDIPDCQASRNVPDIDKYLRSTYLFVFYGLIGAAKSGNTELFDLLPYDEALLRTYNPHGYINKILITSDEIHNGINIYDYRRAYNLAQAYLGNLEYFGDLSQWGFIRNELIYCGILGDQLVFVLHLIKYFTDIKYTSPKLYGASYSIRLNKLDIFNAIYSLYKKDIDINRNWVANEAFRTSNYSLINYFENEIKLTSDIFMDYIALSGNYYLFAKYSQIYAGQLWALLPNAIRGGNLKIINSCLDSLIESLPLMESVPNIDTTLKDSYRTAYNLGLTSISNLIKNKVTDAYI